MKFRSLGLTQVHATISAVKSKMISQVFVYEKAIKHTKAWKNIFQRMF